MVVTGRLARREGGGYVSPVNWGEGETFSDRHNGTGVSSVFHFKWNWEVSALQVVYYSTAINDAPSDLRASWLVPYYVQSNTQQQGCKADTRYPLLPAICLWHPSICMHLLARSKIAAANLKLPPYRDSLTAVSGSTARLLKECCLLLYGGISMSQTTALSSIRQNYVHVTLRFIMTLGTSCSRSPRNSAAHAHCNTYCLLLPTK